MIVWVTDTLIMTGAIMALILLVRRPVGYWFGPGAAYALWALPMIRLLLPPLVLPKSVAVVHAADMLATPAGPAVPLDAGAHAMAVPATVLADRASTWQARLLDLPWGTMLLCVWLGGAALFLAHRIVTYQRMRRELLRGSRSIGRAGVIRIVESWAVDTPVAFGVFDRVVALPMGFLASADSDVSDFAIAHELEHHAGNDLIANMAVQPLFALHWFNPLAWLAWRALRSDQEAACDARVMAGRSRRERERYGRLIASFAAGSRFALAAPMAGPITGDKPVIHRLKVLVRNDVSERHLLLGRSLFAISVIAVPLTASVSYAADEMPEPVAAAEAVPAVRPQQAPAAAVTGLAPRLRETVSVSEKPRDGVHAAWGRDGHISHREPAAELDVAQAEAFDAGDRAELAAERARAHAERLSAAAERMAAEAEARAPRVEQSISADGTIQTMRMTTAAYGIHPATVRTLVTDAGCPADRPARAQAVADGAVSETRICTGSPDSGRHVVAALRQARASVASNRDISHELRSEILAEFDGEIASARAESD